MDELAMSDLARAAMDHAREHEHPAIFNHSVRVLLYARAVSGRAPSGRPVDEDELAVACLLHDLGTTDIANGEQRFEVDGADTADAFLRRWGVQPDARERVWEAIALHTSPGIAERMHPLVRLTRFGVRVDFGDVIDPVDAGFKSRVEQSWPRLDIERALASAVVDQAVVTPSKAPASSWPGGLLHAARDGLATDAVNPAF